MLDYVAQMSSIASCSLLHFIRLILSRSYNTTMQVNTFFNPYYSF